MVEPNGRVTRALRLGDQLAVVPSDIDHPLLEQDRRLQEQAAQGVSSSLTLPLAQS